MARDFLNLSLQLLILLPVVLACGMVLFFDGMGYEVDYLGLTQGVAFGVLFGVAYGLIVGMIGGVAVSMVVSVAVSMVGGVAVSLVGGVVVGVVVGVVRGVAVGMAEGMTVGLAVGAAVGVAVGMIEGIAGGIIGGVVGCIAYFRIPLYPLEALLQTILHLVKSHFHATPVLYHDLSYLPHPFLMQDIVAAASVNPDLGRRLLEACARAPGQRKAGRQAVARLQALELREVARSRSFGSCVGLNGQWLPGVEGTDPLLLSFAKVARFLASAAITSIAQHRLGKLELALNILERRVLKENQFLAHELQTKALPAWKAFVEKALCEAQEEAARYLPNPFRAGDPLDPDLGREVFRGRKDLVRHIEEALGEPGRGCSLVLLGPRRSGKTSLLKMLPRLVPDAICIFFDLQDNPLDTPSAFFAALARTATAQARRDRGLPLPGLPQGAPFEAGARWLEQLDSLPGQPRVLLCIDEFERLENLFPGARRELLQLMGLLRATIQHRRRVRLLVSGATTFEELDSLWDDHLINAREIAMTWLGQADALDLLCRPIPEFPKDSLPRALAEKIFSATGGQPYLLQYCGSELVNLLNRENRLRAQPHDLDTVFEKVLAGSGSYFRQTVAPLPASARSALTALAKGRVPDLAPADRRRLQRRLLLTPDNGLAIPLLAVWLQEEGL